ncbi:hypothetical protein AOLI_G00030270 [Acnodon oligacanthus]
MESPRGQASLKQEDRRDAILDSFKRNDDVFRTTMEGIFQKYSNLDDPGLDVCFETMTFRTRKGVVPIDSAEAEHELQHLRSQVNAEQSLRELESSYNEQSLSEQDMDETHRTENDVITSSQMGNSDDSLWPGTETSQLSLSSVSGSQSCLWGEQSQPEDEDENLEKTLNSHGSTLLDVYPSMLNQIGEAYRRQHVTQAASAVLQRYRRKRWQSSQTQHRNHISSNSLNCTLNKTMESSFSVRKLPHYDMTSHRNGMSSRSNQGISPLKTIRNSSCPSSRNSQELSPLKTIRNSSLAASRSSQELSPLKTIRNSSLAASRSSQELSPLKTIRNSSLAASRSSQELSPLKTIRNSSLAASRSSQELSPLKTIRNSSLAASRSSQEPSPLKTIRNSSLAASRSNRELSPLKIIRNSSLAASRSGQELSPLKTIRNSSLAPSRSSQERSPMNTLGNSSLTSSACFYSPRRVYAEESPVAESRTLFPALCLDTEPQHRPVRVLDLSTPPSSAASSPHSLSPDLNQTYNIDPVAMPTSCDALASAAWSPSRSLCNSPLKGAKNSLFPGQGGRLVTTSPSHHCHSQVGQHLTSHFVSKECDRDHIYSHSPSPQQAIIDGSCSVRRSPFKKVFGQELEQQKSSPIYYPKQTLPANHSDNSAVYRSPYWDQQGVSSSPYRSYHPVSDHQENLAMAEVHQFIPRPPKCQRSSSLSRMASRQIDAEFRRLYHHFICRGTSSSCSSSSCHLCERQLEVSVQGSPTFSSNMSALALTPIQSRLKKRRRQYDVEESLRLKRFRESCSPKSYSCLWPKQQQATKHMSTAVVNPTEEKRIWNRALLLQCPSPGFLRGSGDMRVSRSKPGLHSHFPSQRHVSGCIGPAEARSPMRAWNQSGVSNSPSLSRRRLLYAPLQ